MTTRVTQLNVLPRAAAVLVGAGPATEQRCRVRLFGGLVEAAIEPRPPVVLFVHISRAILHADN